MRSDEETACLDAGQPETEPAQVLSHRCTLLRNRQHLWPRASVATFVTSCICVTLIVLLAVTWLRSGARVAASGPIGSREPDVLRLEAEDDDLDGKDKQRGPLSRLRRWQANMARRGSVTLPQHKSGLSLFHPKARKTAGKKDQKSPKATANDNGAERRSSHSLALARAEEVPEEPERVPEKPKARETHPPIGHPVQHWQLPKVQIWHPPRGHRVTTETSTTPTVVNMKAFDTADAERWPSTSATTAFRPIFVQEKTTPTVEPLPMTDLLRERNGTNCEGDSVIRGSGASDCRMPGLPLLPSCSGPEEDCSKTQCCSGPGMQCYKKNDFWAACRLSCSQGPDPTSVDSVPWNCTELGRRRNGSAQCAAPGANCLVSQCCTVPGMQCYQKDNASAACLATCEKGFPVLSDVDQKPWACKALGQRAKKPAKVAPWVARTCAQDGEGCIDKKCCAVPGKQCYAQNKYWGLCLSNCSQPGWDCTAIGFRTPDAVPPPIPPVVLAPWVAKMCSAEGEDCTDSKCCSGPGMQCFAKDDLGYSKCRHECTPGPDPTDVDAQPWSCRALGPRTPGQPLRPGRPAPAPAWVARKCSVKNDDCAVSQCCNEGGMQCFVKDKTWSTCRASCVPGEDPHDPMGGNWTCEKLGGRTPRQWGTPSLFCFSVARPAPNYEASLMKHQLETNLGIFACDEYSVFTDSDTPWTVGPGPLGMVTSIPFRPAPVGRSKDGTAGNALLFMHVWEAVLHDGLWANLDWTVKVDPDAVLLPERLRPHVAPHKNQKAWIANCNAYPTSGDFPMMYGALEVISRDALMAYQKDYFGDRHCRKGLQWNSWGEDYFLGKCMDLLAAEKIVDTNVLIDERCLGQADCRAASVAAFHPFKDVVSWMRCLNAALHH